MLLETLSLNPLVRALGWALLHSLWQGGLVALGMAALLALLRRRSASLRYGAAYGGLLLMLALPVATAWRLAVSPEAATLERAGAGLTLAASGGQPDLWTKVMTGLAPLLPWMVSGWLLGVLAFSMRLAGGCVQVRRMRLLGAAEAPEPWREAFAALVRRLRVSAPVKLLVSTWVQVPTACGWLRPVVIVPVSALTALPIAQIESLLAHELAHIRRHDYLFNLLQSVVEVLLFYHPGVWWLSERIRAERENCCDDIAVAVCGSVQVYAQTLADLEALRLGALPAPSLAATGGPLLQRIRRLVAPNVTSAEPVGSRLAAAVLVLTAILFGCSMAVRAQSPAGPAPVSEEPTGAAAAEPGSYSLEELRMELACGDAGKLRRCVDPAAGTVRLECVPASPVAWLAESLRGREEDDEVKVEVVRQEPGKDRPARSKILESPGGGRSNGARTVRVREKSTNINLPVCG